MKVYDENNPKLERVGLQGDAMTVSVCTENPIINDNIKMFLDVLNQDSELLGERLRALSGVLKEMGY